MLELGGFKLLAVRTGTRHKSITTIARNLDTAEIKDAPGLIVPQHERGLSQPEFRRQLPEPNSAAVYPGPPSVSMCSSSLS
jgi:hypothetical protein